MPIDSVRTAAVFAALLLLLGGMCLVRTVQRYVLRELAISFALCFAVILFLCLVGMIFQSLRIYAGVGLNVVAESVPSALAYMTPWALITSLCAATTLVFARLSSDQEIDAMALGGISPYRLLLPAIFFAGILCGISHLVHEKAAPWAYRSRQVMRRESILFLLQSPPPGNQTHRLGRYVVGYTNYTGGEMQRPIVVDLRDPENRKEHYAESGRFELPAAKAPEFILRNCEIWEEKPGHSIRVGGRGELRIPIELGDFDPHTKGIKDMSSRELLERASATPTQGRAEALTEYHLRRARTVAPVFLVLLCLAIGILTRRTSRMAGLAAALPPLLLYILCSMLGEGLGRKGPLSPAAAAWLADGVVFGISLPLLFKVMRR